MNSRRIKEQRKALIGKKKTKSKEIDSSSLIKKITEGLQVVKVITSHLLFISKTLTLTLSHPL